MKPKERKERRGGGVEEEEGEEGCTTLEGVGGGSNNRGRFGGKTETDMESHLFQTDGESVQNMTHTHMLIHKNSTQTYRHATHTRPHTHTYRCAHTNMHRHTHTRTCTHKHTLRDDVIFLTPGDIAIQA